MASNGFMRVDDIAEELGVSTSYAYKIIRKLNAELKKIEPSLKQIHPQHFLDPYGRTAAFSLGIIRFNNPYPLIPRDDLVHDLKELFPLGFFQKLYSISV